MKSEVGSLEYEIRNNAIGNEKNKDGMEKT